MALGKTIPFSDDYYGSKDVATIVFGSEGIGPFRQSYEHEYDAFIFSVFRYDEPHTDYIARIQSGGIVRLSLTNMNKIKATPSCMAKDTSIQFPLFPEGLRKVADQLNRIADQLDSEKLEKSDEETQ